MTTATKKLVGFHEWFTLEDILGDEFQQRIEAMQHFRSPTGIEEFKAKLEEEKKAREAEGGEMSFLRYTGIWETGQIAHPASEVAGRPFIWDFTDAKKISSTTMEKIGAGTVINPYDSTDIEGLYFLFQFKLLPSDDDLGPVLKDTEHVTYHAINIGLALRHSYHYFLYRNIAQRFKFEEEEWAQVEFNRAVPFLKDEIDTVPLMFAPMAADLQEVREGGRLYYGPYHTQFVQAPLDVKLLRDTRLMLFDAAKPLEELRPLFPNFLGKKDG